MRGCWESRQRTPGKDTTDPRDSAVGVKRRLARAKEEPGYSGTTLTINPRALGENGVHIRREWISGGEEAIHVCTCAHVCVHVCVCVFNGVGASFPPTIHFQTSFPLTPFASPSHTVFLCPLSPGTVLQRLRQPQLRFQGRTYGWGAALFFFSDVFLSLVTRAVLLPLGYLPFKIHSKMRK